jgi:hypothetical protein
MSLLGCGSQDRQAIQGNVTLDGSPLPNGEIVFIPSAGTTGPTAGSEIKNGGYSVSAANGTSAGVFRVEINAMRKTGRKISTPHGPAIEHTANYIPKRYNEASQLKAEVKSGEMNVIDFELRTK